MTGPTKGTAAIRTVYKRILRLAGELREISQPGRVLPPAAGVRIRGSQASPDPCFAMTSIKCARRPDAGFRGLRTKVVASHRPQLCRREPP